MNKELMFSSKSNEWETPEEFFNQLNYEFGFTLDAAASFDNAKCNKFFDIKTDSLQQDWSDDIVFLNPPYGRELGKWIQKAAESKTTVVCLIPARTDTTYWHKHILNKPNVEIRFIKGRLLFSPNGDRNRRAPFPSGVVIFRNLIVKNQGVTAA